jgi:hypothetical protein
MRNDAAFAPSVGRLHLAVGGLSPVGNTGLAAGGHQSFCLSVQGRLIDLLRLRRLLGGALS